MSDVKKPDPNRPVKLIDIILVHQAHLREIAELQQFGADASEQLEQQKNLEKIYHRFLDLEFDQLLRADANQPDSLTLRIASQSTEPEKLFKELRQKYLDKNFSATLH